MPRGLFAVVLLLSCAAISFVSARTAMRPEVGRFTKYGELKILQPNQFYPTTTVVVVTRFYNIRSLINEINTRRGRVFHKAGIVEFRGEVAAHYETEQEAAAEIIQSVIDMIIQNVDGESWFVNGGSYGGIREIGGVLVITQTAENQTRIAQLLNRLYAAITSPTTQPFDLK